MSGMENGRNGDKRDLKTARSGSASCGAAALLVRQRKVVVEGVRR
jgi:hypothetical protein